MAQRRGQRGHREQHTGSDRHRRPSDAELLEVKRQNLTWVLPYHEGAVRALKEAGAWKPEHDAHNQKLLKRQETLASAWGAFLKTNPPEDKAAFSKGWLAARKAALAAAGMDPVFE